VKGEGVVSFIKRQKQQNNAQYFLKIECDWIIEDNLSTGEIEDLQ
jgi:hypothetical protein